MGNNCSCVSIERCESDHSERDGEVEANWLLLASTTTTRARRTIWASRKEIFSTSLTPRRATGGSRSTRIAGTRGLSLATILPNTSRWTPKSELNAGFTVCAYADSWLVDQFI